MHVPVRLYAVVGIIVLGLDASLALAGHGASTNKQLQPQLLESAKAPSGGALEHRNNNRHLSHSSVEYQDKEVCNTPHHHDRAAVLQGDELNRKFQGKRYTKFMSSHPGKKSEW